ENLDYEVRCETLSAPVHVDRSMWEKVVLNLLSNAFKFTFKGAIRVTLREVRDRAVLEIADTGIGIPGDELERIFDRFHRVEGANGRTHEGFGIGLAMIRELVQLHGGSVRVQSRPGEGSVFTVSLPFGTAHLPIDRIAQGHAASHPAGAAPYVLEAQSWASPQPPIAPPPVAGIRESRAARVLVADDNADMREYVGRLLGEHWQVETVADGAKALDRMRLDPLPDLVVSDIMMPNLDGHGLVRALRADPRTSSIPVLLVSARAGEDAMIEGLDSGADDYIVKPFAGRELVARVRTHLRLARLRSDAAAIERIGGLLNSQLDLHDLVQLLTDEATKLSGGEFGAFFYNVIDTDGEKYMLYSLSGAPREAFAGFPMPRNTAIFAPTFAGEGIIRRDDIRADPKYGQSAPYHGMPEGHIPVRSYLAVPVVSRSGEVHGGLFFGHSLTAQFDERSERLIGAVANPAAIAIDNAQLYHTERRARAEAEASARAKDEFLAMLGHELRNPLAPIVTALEIMEQAGDGPTKRERAIIQRQVAHVVRLVDDLLDVARIARGKIDLKRETLEVSHFVSKAVEIASPLLEQRAHRLELDVPERGLCVRGDLVRLAQVTSNLLSNAAKFTDPGGRIVVRAARDGDEVVVRVIDDGIGLSRADAERVFEMFSQSAQSLDRSQGGLGLGLAIARNLVQLHGGTIAARSEGPGRGSEFIVRLPRHSGEPESEHGADPRPQREGGRLRILVVDDNVDAAETLAHALALFGHETATAFDGPSALRLSVQFHPDVCLLDLGLPVMDGFELARRLRALPETRGARLIAVTGYGQRADLERSADAGFDAHTVKPVDFPALLELLHPPAPSG
ncbi:MAG TPA: ATP-binding protein, partial [Candidatus Saccharimonadia bacterium]|nr:ATP-binding protein [Candidatus Saccharimonadia bacterium]